MKLVDFRQLIYRGILQQIFPWIGGQNGQTIMSSVDQELTPPFCITANYPTSLVVQIGPSNVANSVNGRNKTASFLDTSIPHFTSGTVTFPSTSGGNITTSTGGSFPLVLPVGDYVQVLLAIDLSNNLNITVGIPNTTPVTALVPAPQASTQPFGYITLFNSAGTIQNITQENCYQFAGSGGGSGSGGGLAEEVALTVGVTTQFITFPVPRSNANYSLVCQLVNTVDPDPQFQPLTIVSKTLTGFQVEFDAPLDTGNYALDYIVGSGTNSEIGEFGIALGATSAVISLPIPFPDTNYVVVATMSDYADPLPQFQPLTVTNKSLSSFTISWNAPTDSASANVSWMAAHYT